MKDYSDYYPSYSTRRLSFAEIVFAKQVEHEGQVVKMQGKDVKVIIRNHGNPTDEYKEERYLITHKSIPLHRNYVINYLGDDYIIITDIDRDNAVYNTCKLKKATLHISFLKSNGDICTMPIFDTTATKYSDGLYENKEIKVGDTQKAIVVPLTEDTKDFYIGQRFLFDRTHAYEITDNGINRFENKEPDGLREMIIIQCPIHTEVDNLDLLIADYYGKAHDYKLEVDTNNIILTGARTYAIRTKVTDKSIEIENPLIEYEVLDKTIISLEGNVVKGIKKGSTSILVKFKSLTEIINVEINDTHVILCTSEILGSDNIPLGESENYTFKSYENGVQSQDIPIWSITDENGNKTSYGDIMINNDKTCKVSITKDWIFNDLARKCVYLHCKSINCKEITKTIKITQY